VLLLRPPGTRSDGDDACGAGQAADDEGALEAGVDRRHDHAVPEHREAADQGQREQHGGHCQRSQLE